MLKSLLRYEYDPSAYDLIIGVLIAIKKLPVNELKAMLIWRDIALEALIKGPKKILINMVLTWDIPTPATDPNSDHPEKDSNSLNRTLSVGFL